jgi:hypothetical protein
MKEEELEQEQEAFPKAPWFWSNRRIGTDIIDGFCFVRLQEGIVSLGTFGLASFS